MQEFASHLPSDFFRWCIKNAKFPDGLQRYDDLFANYAQAVDGAEYLWLNYDNRLRPLIEMSLTGKRVLEVGCGLGHDLVWSAIRGAVSVGIDVKSEWVEAARGLYEQVSGKMKSPLSLEIRHQNVLDFADGESFDVVWMKDTFHHLEPRERIVEKLAKLLAPKGKLIIQEPNAWNPLIQLQMFRIRKFRTIVEKIDKKTGERFIYGNERLISAARLRREFEAHSVTGYIEYFRLLPTRFCKSSTAVKACRFLERNFANKRLLTPFWIHYVFVGNKC